jgi:hypothetical protein
VLPRLERALHLLQLVRAEMNACGGCTVQADRRLEEAAKLIQDCLGIRSRHDEYKPDPPE